MDSEALCLLQTENFITAIVLLDCRKSNEVAENQRMSKLVDDLLTLSRANTVQQMVEKEMFMLDEAILESLATFEAMADEKA